MPLQQTIRKHSKNRNVHSRRGAMRVLLVLISMVINTIDRDG
ncbi:MAG: hypothetical protein WCR23_06340 [Planctomycetota bacterium]